MLPRFLGQSEDRHIGDCETCEFGDSLGRTLGMRGSNLLGEAGKIYMVLVIREQPLLHALLANEGTFIPPARHQTQQVSDPQRQHH